MSLGSGRVPFSLRRYIRWEKFERDYGPGDKRFVNLVRYVSDPDWSVGKPPTPGLHVAIIADDVEIRPDRMQRFQVEEVLQPALAHDRLSPRGFALDRWTSGTRGDGRFEISVSSEGPYHLSARCFSAATVSRGTQSFWHI